MVSLDGGDGTGALSGLSERGQLATAGTTLRVSIKVQQEPEEAKSNCGVKGGIYYDLILQLSYLQSLNSYVVAEGLAFEFTILCAAQTFDTLNSTLSGRLRIA